MTTVTMESSTPPTLEEYYGYYNFDVANDSNESAPTIYVPTGSVETYKAADGWGTTYGESIEAAS